MRLMAGILAGQTFDSTLTGAPQLLRRPMRRISSPLKEMGAEIEDVDGHGPLSIRGRRQLHGAEHHLQVASAQVKSAILLAGLYADGPVIVHQPGPARDHTERMLAAQIESQAEDTLTYDDEVILLDPEGIERLRPVDRIVPGDFSSAAFILATGLLVPSSEVTLLGVGVNPTRTGLLDVFAAMGADLVMENQRDQGGEPVADITVKASFLGGTEVKGSTVVRMIDEFPVLAVVATQAEGSTVVREAEELRVKETDRIEMVATELRKLGARIETQPDGFVVEGPVDLEGAEVDSHGDHRLGMALAVAGLIARGETRVQGAACIADSFPDFVEVMELLGADIHYGL
jgi:3-phosphoshikimate 1-carboxyvinyltransferase